MKRIPEEKIFTRKQLLKKVRFFKWIVSNFAKEGRIQKNTNGKELILDTEESKIRVLAYNAENPNKLPLFVNMHGGGFILGRPEMDDPYLMNVAKSANVKILSVDYSLSPEETFPKALNECYAVVRYAKENAEKLVIDPAKIAVGGHSAGGNLSAAIALKAIEKKELNITHV